MKSVDDKPHLRCDCIDWSEVINANQAKLKRWNMTILLLKLAVGVVFIINATHYRLFVAHEFSPFILPRRLVLRFVEKLIDCYFFLWSERWHTTPDYVNCNYIQMRTDVSVGSTRNITTTFLRLDTFVSRNPLFHCKRKKTYPHQPFRFSKAKEWRQCYFGRFKILIN